MGRVLCFKVFSSPYQRGVPNHVSCRSERKTIAKFHADCNMQTSSRVRC